MPFEEGYEKRAHACARRLPPLPTLAATSWDVAHPPEHTIDGDDRTFWVTTGMFPQELVVALETRSEVSRISLRSVGIRRLSIQASPSETPGVYDTVVPETEVADSGRSRQSETFSVRIPQARHVKFIIHAGWDHFVTINDIQIEGHKL